jgi:aromatic-amino-acid transaminase
MTSNNQLFSAVELAPRDPILGLNESFNADPNPGKVNLGIGVYLNDDGKIPLMQAVEIVQKARLNSTAAHSYLPIDGLVSYNLAVKKLLFKEDLEALNDSILTVQTLGGTGGIKVGADFLKTIMPGLVVAISNPTWENHRAIFEFCGFKVVEYSYYDQNKHDLNFDNMVESLNLLPRNSIVLLHACCHNPTGIDLSASQWNKVIDICQAKDFVPFIDMAYQGFANGLKEDSEVISKFIKSGLTFLIANSFSKTFSLYGQRVGALSIVTKNANQAKAVLSQIKRIIRTNYSNPPAYGASLISDILNSNELYKIWQNELDEMRHRIKLMRQNFTASLEKLCPNHDFSFINAQNGMFSYSGLSSNQVDKLMKEHGIYALSTGRICVAALTSKNIDIVTNAIKSVI